MLLPGVMAGVIVLVFSFIILTFNEKHDTYDEHETETLINHD